MVRCGPLPWLALDLALMLPCDLGQSLLPLSLGVLVSKGHPDTWMAHSPRTLPALRFCDPGPVKWNNAIVAEVTPRVL